MKTGKRRILFLILLLAGMLTCRLLMADTKPVYAAGEEGSSETEEAKNAVKPVSVDYEDLWLVVDANGNQKVFYSDKSQKVWYEAVEATQGRYYIDISWLSNTSATVINLKGDVCDEVVPVTLPARNSKFKAKYDKVTGAVTFEGVPDGVTTFEWRKATAYQWTSVSIADAGKEGSVFREQIEKMRISGASIYVRLPQTEGKVDANGVFQAGTRQSKEIKLSIAKRANAPKITIDGSKLTLSTKTTMEYSTDNGTTWKTATAKMPIASIAPSVLSASPTSATVLFRYAATAKKAYSKTASVTIPAQRIAPFVSTASGGEVVYESDAAKFYLTFNKASKTTPYEYTIVKAGNTLDLTKASWKAVTSAKKVSVSAKTAPAGSVIYVRKKTIKEGKETKFEIASAMKAIPVTYTVAPSAAPTGSK